MKLRDVLPIVEGLMRLGKEKLPTALAFEVKREIKKLRPIVEDYDATRKELAERLGAVTEETGRMTIPVEGRAEFSRENLKLVEVTVDYTPRVIVRMDDLKGRDIEADVLTLLGPLCEE